MRSALGLFVFLLGCRDASPLAPKLASPPRLTHGVAALEAKSDSVILWARASAPSTFVAEVVAPDGETREVSGVARADNDYTVGLAARGLRAATRYRYSIRAIADGRISAAEAGQFTTAPIVDEPVAVAFAWSGDLGGQNACRDAKRGYEIAAAIASAAPAFFVALGDMIYADGVCEAKGAFGNAQIAGDFGRATDIEAFWAHWRYNREDPAFAALLASVAYYPTWDDHEVVNDFGGGHPLAALGARAFLDWNPLAKATPFYRNLRWGKHLELFFLDNRSYRDANTALDNGALAKTMLGAAQLAWLKAGLRDSDATWKIVVSSVPIAIPTGSGPPDVSRDGWADFGSGQGFERELADIVAAGAAANMLWITTDVHFATALRYPPRTSAGVAFHEVIVGPMSAGLFPTTDLDDTFAPERLFLHAPADPEKLSYDEALAYMTFGVVNVDERGGLRVQIADGRGAELFVLRLEPR